MSLHVLDTDILSLLQEGHAAVVSRFAARPRANPSDPADPIPDAFSVQSGLWVPLATELLDEAATVHAEDVRASLQLCQLLL